MITTVKLAVRNWYHTHVTSKKSSSGKANNRAKIPGGQAISRAVYRWVGIAIGGVVIAGLILSPFFLKSMTTNSVTDQQKPSGNLNGIKDRYREGEKVVYVVNGKDNEALQQVTFTVVDSPTPVQNNWEMSGQEFTKPSSFSTKDWPANKQYTYLLTIIDKTGNILEKRGSFWLEENVVPYSKISGFKESYLVGEKINGFVEVSKSEAVKIITFTVANSPVKITLKGNEPLSFSTQGWQPGTYPYSLMVTDKEGHSQEEQGHLVLTAVPPPAPPVASDSGSQKGSSIESVAELLRECKKRYNEKRLTPGEGGTALACYQEVLTKYPNNPEAKDGLKQLETTYQTLVEQALKRRNSNDALTYLQQLEKVNPTSAELLKLKQRLVPPKSDEETPKPLPNKFSRAQKKTKVVVESKSVPKSEKKTKLAPRTKVVEKSKKLAPRPAPEKEKKIESRSSKVEKGSKPSKPPKKPPKTPSTPSKCITDLWGC
jgi:hypothetical protein